MYAIPQCSPLKLQLNICKLQTSYPRAANYHHEIEETCRVFPMTLRVVGFSRVPVPLALPASSGSYTPSKISSKSKEKGKEKANDPASPASTYDPLVYALPVIHVVGEFRGSDVNESVARRARGTVRMIGDRAIRWNLVCCFSTSSVEQKNLNTSVTDIQRGVYSGKRRMGDGRCTSWRYRVRNGDSRDVDRCKS